MKISISKVSWHANFYKWFYQVWILPTSLCPYFWKLLLALILIIPVFSMSLPIYIYNIFKKEDNRLINDDFNHLLRCCMGVVCYLLVVFLSRGALFIYHYFTGMFYSIGEFTCFVVTICLFLGVLLVILFSRIINSSTIRQDRREIKWLNANPEKDIFDYEIYYRSRKRWYHAKNWLLVKMVVAIYTKVCPLIEWKS